MSIGAAEEVSRAEMPSVTVVHNGHAMNLYSVPKLIAVAAMLRALPGLAVTCEELRAQVESKIRGAGVAEFSVAVVDAGASAPGKIVGTCDRGGKKLLYTQAASVGVGTKAWTEPTPASNRPAKKVEPILTECKDGSVAMNADCKK